MQSLVSDNVELMVFFLVVLKVNLDSEVVISLVHDFVTRKFQMIGVKAVVVDNTLGHRTLLSVARFEQPSVMYRCILGPVHRTWLQSLREDTEGMYTMLPVLWS